MASFPPRPSNIVPNHSMIITRKEPSAMEVSVKVRWLRLVWIVEINCNLDFKNPHLTFMWGDLITLTHKD